MLLVIFLTGVILWNLPPSKYDNIVCASQVEPGYLDFDNLPDTNFSCEGKVIGGYYADIETGCQMFHVCTIGQKSEITDIKFLCLNGTVFDQETRVCERLDEVDCSRSESFFDLNLELYGNNGGGYGIQPEDETKDSVDENCDEEYEDGENSCKMKSEKDDAAKHKDDEYSDWEEATTSTPPSPAPKVVSSTSTAAPTSTVKSTPSTSTRSQFVNTQPKFSLQPLGNNGVQTSLTTPNPSLQLLALHESFQENLNKNREAQGAPRPPSAPSAVAAVANRAPSPPPAVSTYQIQNAAATQTKPSFPPPLPNKLPNTVSNLSQKTHFPTPLATANVNRTPPTAPQAVTFKSEPPRHQQTSFYTNKQHSQRVTLKPSQPPSSSSSLSALAPPQKPALDTSILYRYNIFSTSGAGAGGAPTRPEPFGSSSARYNVPPSPSTTPSQTFKVESVHVNPYSRPTFTLAQTRPNSFNSKAQHFIAAKETVGDEEEEEIEEEEEEAEVEEDAAEPELPANHHHHHHQQQQQQSHSPPQKFSNYNLHTNFARAIPEANNKNSSGVPAAISVVQSSSSVSSSISSKPHSAISNSSSPASSSAPVKSSFSNANNNNNKKAGGANSFASTLLNARGTNITEINEQLTEEQPYYEEASVDYEESSHEYKDILYPATDVQKIKHR